MSATPQLQQANRLAIKIGSLLIADSDTGHVRTDWLQSIAADIATLRQQGTQIILISSGSVTLGRRVLGLDHTNLQLNEKQAAAACGQIALIQAWQQALAPHQLSVAQMLLTAADTENRRRYLNARTALDTLLERGIIPIINENDCVSTAEIRYGDNDRLAARVAAMASADQLILLSDIDGLYTADPKTNPDATLIPLIDTITPDIQAMAGDSQDHRSSGGMKTKLLAAQIATSAGCHMAIAYGHRTHPLQAIMDGGACSWFTAHSSPLSARAHWIAEGINQGNIIVDDGAARALQQGNSLLPVGVTAVKGTFDRGDSVRILNSQGEVIGHGLTNYSHHEAQSLIGKHSHEIEALLGYQGRDTLIHRNDMVMK